MFPVVGVQVSSPDISTLQQDPISQRISGRTAGPAEPVPSATDAVGKLAAEAFVADDQDPHACRVEGASRSSDRDSR